MTGRQTDRRSDRRRDRRSDRQRVLSESFVTDLAQPDNDDNDVEQPLGAYQLRCAVCAIGTRLRGV